MVLIHEITDAPGDQTTTQVLGIGQIVAGAHSSATDTSDWYKITLTAGVTYGFALVGTGADRLADPLLHLYGTDGTTLLATDDDNFSNTNSGIIYTATTSGTYYIDANQFSVGGTTYELSATAITNGSKALVDDAMIVGAINTGDHWASTNITYGFRSTVASYTAGGSNISSFTALTPAEIAAVHACLLNYSDVCGLTFTQVDPVAGVDQATMLFGNYTDATDGAGAFAYYPGSTTATDRAGDVWLNTTSVSTTSDALGSWDYMTMLHEIGHTTGLSHPGSYNAAPGVSITYANDARFAEDSNQYTVMSYFDASSTGASVGAYTSTLMLYDIRALQLSYGANMATRNGNTTYGFGSTAGAAYDFATNSNAVFCIWDGGGVDTLNASGFTQNQHINLGAGTFSDVGGFVSNVSIAFNCVIENAVGGSGNDIITGNAANNTLSGGAGADTLNGGLGSDVLNGGAGADILIGGGGVDTADYHTSIAGVTVNLATNVNTGADAQGDSLSGISNLTGSNSVDVLTGNGSANTLSGLAGSDTLNGELGNDILIGGTGADFLIGGGGVDTADYHTSIAGVTVNLATNVNTGGDAQGDSLSGISNLTGSNSVDVLTGNGSANVLSGLAGSDFINGGLGNDTLTGGAGADQLTGGGGVDTADYRTSLAAVSINLLTNVNTGGDAQGDMLFGILNVNGSNYADTIHGDNNANTLFGGAGVDQLFGEGGNDTLEGGAGADAIDGGAGVNTASYSHSVVGVSINLLTHIYSGGDATGDTLTNIQNIYGSNQALTGDTLIGDNGANALYGYAGNDILDGGLGNDVLNGGADHDTFRFDTTLNSTTNVDTILDFVSGTDTIAMGHTIFTGLAVGVVASANFVHGLVATLAQAEVLYDQSTGNLYFDVDGLGAGAAIKFAHVTTGMALSNLDFLVV